MPPPQPASKHICEKLVPLSKTLNQPEVHSAFRVPLPTWALTAWIVLPFGIAVLALFTNGADYLVGGLVVGLGLGVLEALVQGYVSGTWSNAIAFVVMSPQLVKPDYAVNVEESLLKELHANELSELDVMCIVTIPNHQPDKMTINLLGPIIINVNKRCAVQIICTDEHLHVDPVLAGVGRFGPYVRHGSKYKSIPAESGMSKNHGSV